MASAGLLVTAAVLTSPIAGMAQDVTLSGQVRPRTEYLDTSGPVGGSAWTSMRSRVAVLFENQGPVSAFLQFQDVRIFGEESSTLGDFNADNIDLHQGWLELGREESVATLRVGRQEAAYGGERLVGSVNWTQQGRSFDGARVRVRASERFRLDVLGFQISEADAPPRDTDATFWGAYGVWDVGQGRELDLFTLRQHTALEPGETDQWTAGLRYVAGVGELRYRVEGAWQTGERNGSSVSAFLVGARVGGSFADGRAGLTLWADYLSGNDPEGSDVGSFETLFATNHKFYGYADLFLNIPAHTAGRGLMDLALKGRLQITENWTANLDVHRFRVAEGQGLTTSDLGTEIDLTLSRSLLHGLGVSGGASYVIADDALAPVRGISGDVTFAYLMLDAAF